MSHAVELREVGERSPLLASLHDPQRERERRQRQSLLQGSDTLARASNRLEQGHRSLVETEELGNDVLASLQRQRQQMKNTQETMLETADELGSSDRTLRMMYLQSLISGGLSYLLCGVVLASLLLITYAKLRSYGFFESHAPPPPPLLLPPPPKLFRTATAALPTVHAAVPAVHAVPAVSAG